MPSPSTSHHTPCAALVNAVPPRAKADPTIVPEIASGSRGPRADQPTGERGEHHDQHPYGQQAQPGRQRRHAAHVLQVLGGHEQECAEPAQGKRVPAGSPS
jgi:hypothetical protein